MTVRGKWPRPTITPTCHPDRAHFAFGQCQPCYHHGYYVARKDKWREKQSGYAPGQFDRMVAAQDGRCPLCGDQTALVADHDHQTGLPRKLICQVCNKALGMLHDDPDLITRAAEYIASFRPLAFISAAHV